MACNIAEVKVVVKRYVSPCDFKLLSQDYYMICLRTSKKISLGELIYYGIYQFLTIVYVLFEVFMLCLESFQVHACFGAMWRLWRILELMGDFRAYG